MLLFSERTARYVTDWVGNWQHVLETFHSAERTFIFNIKSQSECYYYEFIVVLILQY